MHLLSRAVRSVVGSLCAAFLLAASVASADTLDSHTVVLDSDGKIIPWTANPGQGYDQVINLAWNFLLNGVPIDSKNGKPYYYSYSYLEPTTMAPGGGPHNPAGLYGMLTESALYYYAYSGNIEVVNLAVNVATAQLDRGMTPAGGWSWPNVPYASGDEGSLDYHGASVGDVSGSGDGTGVIEPDKVGEMGYAWLQLYRFGGNARFLEAAIASANALASHVRSGSATQSPWPFRVYAETGVVREDYCANTIAPIRLFDELIRLGLGNVTAYQAARQTAWNWLMAFPMQNNIWANYFEDVQIQPDTNNVNQYNAMMTARYLLEHPEYDPSWESHVRGLISWVESKFKVLSYGANTITISEQMVFWHPMGSHTSRYASINAMLHEKTGDADAREKAYRSLNWSTYMARDNGLVIDGPEVNHVWFTDGYGDYIRHFITGMGAVPDWAPAGQDHLVRSSSVVKNITYSPSGVNYITSDSASTEVLRTGFTPAGVTADGQALNQRSDLNAAGWTFDPTRNVLRIRHDSGTNIQVAPGTLVSIGVTPEGKTITTGSTQQFTATGTYTGGSTQNITSQTVWSSSVTGVATINSSGLSTAAGAGSTTISAALNGISGSATLIVQATPLAITTVSLPGGSAGIPYSASLAASGGTPPYSWSIIAGSLPTGLLLGSSDGIISGTPAAGGTFNFTVQAADGQLTTASKNVSIIVATQANFSIWTTTNPVIGDSGPDSAVELGVKFRSDANGTITGIRFYKAATNTGTHIGNLWTTSGTRLATATFTGETASGWQQVNFATPVAITANSVYVASYHTNAGHYSCDQNFFAAAGVDRPPLHAPANGVSGVNGVYAYGSASRYPSLGWRSSNYWVDVVFSTVVTPPATLASIAVTPADQTIQTGATIQFTATGTYSDGSTQNISGLAAWSSSSTGVVSISSSGLATATGAGSSIISATQSGITGTTTLTVQPAPLTITTVSLPGGTLNIPYTARLAAGGGVLPYSWSIIAGSLPTGLSLDSSTGVISGTPAAGGTFAFRVQVDDAGIPEAATIRDLSIVITPDTTPPTAPANLTAIAASTTQVNLSWIASVDNIAVAGYRVMRNGSQIASSGSAAYSDNTVAAGTLYSYTVRAYDAAGNVSADSNTASVTTPTVLTAPVLDISVTTKQSVGGNSISSPRFSTGGPNELLLAFIASDGPNAAGSQRITSVEGGGLIWTMRARANGQAGTAEIWQATAPGVATNITVTATRANGSYQGMITVAAFQGASLTTNGAAANASAAQGAPAVSLVTTRANSVVWGVGDDWDRAVFRTVSSNQTKLSEFLAPAGDTFWVQYLTAPVATAGATATISCTAPTNDRWNLAAIEIVPQ